MDTNDHVDTASHKSEGKQEEYHEEPQGRTKRNFSIASAADRMRQNQSAKLANPLEEFSDNDLEEMALDFVKDHAISDEEDVRAFRLGAILAKDPGNHQKLSSMATAEEMAVLEKEYTHRWSQPKLLYLVIILCSTCAAVQGMGKSFPISSEAGDRNP